MAACYNNDADDVTAPYVYLFSVSSVETEKTKITVSR